MHEHTLLKTVAKMLIPLIALFAFYVHFHGDFGPGGGFQAGVILAASVILYALIFGLESTYKVVPPSWVHYSMSLGVLLYGGTGIATILLGGNFLDFTQFAPKSTHAAGQHYGILAVELGVISTVSSVILAVFYAFAQAGTTQANKTLLEQTPSPKTKMKKEG